MFGPDGKPINIGSAQLIGGPKTLDDVLPFNDETITALGDGAIQLLQSGQPMEVPAAMPMGQIVQISKTMLVQRERIWELESLLADITHVNMEPDDRVRGLRLQTLLAPKDQTVAVDLGTQGAPRLNLGDLLRSPVE